MRSLFLGAVLLVAGAAGASAQPWFGPGYGPPPPPYGYGYGPRPGYGLYGRPPGYGGYGYRRRCFIRPGFYGPERVCRW